MRTCIITKEKCEKKDLVRIVRTKDNEVLIDLTGKKNGRGAYLKKSLEVFEKAEMSKILDRVLEVNVDKKIYDELKELVK